MAHRQRKLTLFFVRNMPKLLQRHQNSMIDVNLVASVVLPGETEQWFFLKITMHD